MHIDYLRFGSFDTSGRALMMSELPPESRKATHWLQYTGDQGRHTFGGVATQGGRRHFIAHTSGPLAHEYWLRMLQHKDDLITDTLSCRRIDLCHDLEDPITDRFTMLAEMRVKHKEVTHIDSSDGWTIYVNKRQGDFMVRLYRKYERGQTRLEFECKHGLSDYVWAWTYLAEDPAAALILIWNGLLNRARLPEHIERVFTLGKDKAVVKVPAAASNIEGKIQWMFSALTGIEKMADDHVMRDRVIDAVGVFASHLIGKYSKG